MDSVQFAQRHQQQMMISKADDLGERRAIMPGRFNAADLADCRERPLRFHHQPDQLHDTAARFSGARALDAAKGGFDLGQREVVHEFSDWRIISSFVSRRASTTPKRV